MSDDALQIRADSIEDADIDDIWVAGHPLGKLVERASERGKRVDKDLDDLERRLDALDERLSDAKSDAEMAVSIAARGPAEADGGDATKAGRARRLSRDEVIRATADGKNAGPRDNKTGERGDIVGSVTVSDVKEMAKPRTQLAWKTIVEDAWPKLLEEWPCFRIEDPDGGSKRLTVDPDEIPTDLARVVERSLEREDIANRVVGTNAAVGD